MGLDGVQRRDVTPAGNELRLRTAYRKQHLLMAQFRATPRGLPVSLREGIRREFYDRMARIGAEITALRETVLGPEPQTEDDPKVAERTAYKVACRADSTRDAALVGSPDLVPFEAKPLVKDDPYERFVTSFVETDPGGKYTFSETLITALLIPQNAVYHHTRDFGATVFTGDFTHSGECKITGSSVTEAATAGVYAVSTVDDHMTANPQDVLALMPVRAGPANNNYYYLLRQYLNTAATSDNTAQDAGLLDQQIYYDVDRVGSTVTGALYTGADKEPGDLYDTLVIDDDGTARRYLHGLISRNTGAASAISFTSGNIDCGLYPANMTASTDDEDGIVYTFTTAPQSPASINLYADGVQVATGVTSGGSYDPGGGGGPENVVSLQACGVWNGIEGALSEAASGYIGETLVGYLGPDNNGEAHV